MPSGAIGNLPDNSRHTAHLQFKQFVDFAQDAGEETIAGDTGFVIKPKEKRDYVGHILRSSQSRTMNNHVRDRFMNSILTMFGVTDENQLPDSVKTAMKLEDFNGKGKPLTVRRIRAVQVAVEQEFSTVTQSIEGMATAQGIALTNDVKKQIALLVRMCMGDEDARDIMTADLRSFLYLRPGILCPIHEQKTRLDNMIANLATLRTAANGNQTLFAAGKKFLTGMVAAGLKPDQFQTVLTAIEQGAQRITPQNITALTDKAHSDPAELDKAIRTVLQSLNGTTHACQNILAGFHGTDKEKICRNFLLGLMLQKCGGPDIHRKVLELMNSKVASDLKGIYRDIVADLRAAPGTGVFPGAPDLASISPGKKLYIADLVDQESQCIDQLKDMLDEFFGTAAPVHTPIKPTDLDTRNFTEFLIITRHLKGNLEAQAQQMMENDKRTFMDSAVQGDGPGADMLRHVIFRKIGDEPYKPAETLTNSFQTIARGMIAHGIAPGCSSLASAMGQVKFDSDRIGLQVFLPIGDQRVELSTNFSIARNQVSAFVTHGAKNDFQSLDAAEKNKVYITMSLITQNVAKAAFTGPALVLNKTYDPKAPLEEGKLTPAFTTKGDYDKPDKQSLEFSFGEDGSLKATFSGQRNISALNVIRDDNETTVQTPASGSLSVGYVLTIGKDAFDRMAAAPNPGNFQVGTSDLTCSEFRITPEINAPKKVPQSYAQRSTTTTTSSLHVSSEDSLRHTVKSVEDEYGPASLDLNDETAEELEAEKKHLAQEEDVDSVPPTDTVPQKKGGVFSRLKSHLHLPHKGT